jgi:hypothetical protein
MTVDGIGAKVGAMRCAQGHENSEQELFCGVCGSTMPPVDRTDGATWFRWRDDARPESTPEPLPPPEPAELFERVEPAPEPTDQPPLPRAELRRRKHPLRYKLKALVGSSRHS